MSPKKSLRIGFLIVIANGLTVWGIYAFSMLNFSTQISSIYESSESTKKFSASLAGCIAELKNNAESYLSLRDESRRAAFASKVQECSRLVATVDTATAPEAERKHTSELLRSFSVAVMEIGARIQSTDNSIRSAIKALEEHSHSIKQARGNAEITNHLSSLVLQLSSYLVARAEIQEVALTPHRDAVMALLKTEKKASTSLKAGIEDSLVDLAAAVAVWNRVIHQMEESYTPLGTDLIKAISNLSGHHIDSIRNATIRTMSRLKLVGFLSFLSILIFFGIISSMFRWLSNTYSSVLKNLEDVSKRILGGDVSVTQELADAERWASSLDELGTTYKAISQTLSELGNAKKSLEQKIDELNSAQEQIIQSGKLAGLGTMAAGIAHELNNPLGICFSSAEALQDPSLPVELRGKMLENIKTQTMRATKIISQMKRLARKSDSGDASETPVALKTLVDNSLILVEDRIKRQCVTVERRTLDSLEILCDPVKVESLISNVLQNALDAFEEPAIKDREGKKLTIESEMIPKGGLLIKLGDNGPGIPEHVKAKIFEPFFTTKEVGKGTGLGLSICFQIVHEMGGTISCQSQPGTGTQFHITIPVTRVLSSSGSAAAAA